MVKKGNEKWLWFAGGFVIAYVLHSQIAGLVAKARSTIGMRGSVAYHAKTPRLGWQRAGFPGQGYGYGRVRNPFYY